MRSDYIVKSGTVLAAFVAALAMGGCTKEDVRLFKLYTFQLDDAPKKAPRRHVAKAPSNDNDVEKKVAEDAAAGAASGTSAIETGSTSSDACQGEHIAYQATKEYLKNFGPKPADEPGEIGPCKASAQEPAPKQ